MSHAFLNVDRYNLKNANRIDKNSLTKDQIGQVALFPCSSRPDTGIASGIPYIAKKPAGTFQ